MREVSYAKSSLNDISKDDIVQQIGTVVRNSDGSIVLSDKSQCTFVKTFTVRDGLSFKTLKIDSNIIRSSEAVSSRYRVDCFFDITIQYYKEGFDDNGISLGYVDGDYQTIRVLPHYRHEKDMSMYSLEIETKEDLIKRIGITIAFYDSREGISHDTITIKSLRLFNSLTTEQVVKSTHGWSAVVRRITKMGNGYALGYTGEKEKTTLLMDIIDNDGTDELVQIIVNSTKDSEVNIEIDSKMDEFIPRR